MRFGEVLGLDRRDRAHVDDDLARATAPRPTPFAPNSTCSTSGVSGTIVMIDVGLLGDFAAALAQALPPASMQSSRHACCVSWTKSSWPPLIRLSGHGRAHDAEPDESDFHEWLLRGLEAQA